MSPVKILRETEDTVTISRDDWQRLQEQLEEAQDRAAIAARRGRERRIGKQAARRDYLDAAEAIRLLNGASPVKVWREKRGLSQRALASRAGISPAYLAEIETGRKPGSGDALRKLAATLQVAAEDLDARRYATRNPSYGPVSLRFGAAIGVSPGDRQTSADRRDFPAIKDALDFIRENWSSLRAVGAWIADAEGWPIYDIEELMSEIEG